ncbi:DUF1853 family protein [Marinobacterium maritimum]|uniref:DUF1853 family protein n=1 Tax=Marinobacterium maritimum TaxID=500162 RepID=A0ABN1I207_9GAMM
MKTGVERDPFQQPVIRHLAWLCRAPQLYRGALTFDPVDWLPNDYLQQLQYWDRHPESMPDLLRQAAPRRLGLYFEQLYACLLQDLLGWPLLARNLQVRDQQRTLGELDFLVRNPQTGDVEHHEIAVKFYLGHTDAETRQPYWFGPNSRDRLDLKTARLLQHQTRLAAQPAAQPVLESLGLQAPPTPRIFMPGYLFYPCQGKLPAPEQADPDHGQGRWCYASEVLALEPEGWVVLHKPHWLVDWQQPEAPLPGRLLQAAAEVQQSGRACLLARVVAAPTGWVEVERLFVVPNNWPEVPSKG